MSENKPGPAAARFGRQPRQKGVAAVEFALIAIAFFTLAFGIVEIARIVYLFNTLQEVTRRAAARAANSAFDQATTDRIREQSLFRDRDGNLLLAHFVTPDHIKIEYLSVSRDGTTGALSTQPASPMPACPARNQINCLTDPYSSSCIRLVRVRVCQPGGTGECDAVPYQMLFPLVGLSPFTLPHATTITPAQSLGRRFNTLPCP